jgi:hypothetical protein
MGELDDSVAALFGFLAICIAILSVRNALREANPRSRDDLTMPGDADTACLRDRRHCKTGRRPLS